MKQFSLPGLVPAFTLSAFSFLSLLPANSSAQQLSMYDLVLYGNTITLSSSSTVNGGSVASVQQVTTTGSATFKSNIFSKGTVSLTNSNTVTGRIAVGIPNTARVAATLLSVGSNAGLSGNIDVNGNIVIGGGTVPGQVTQPAGATYSGPNPGSRGSVLNIPTFPTSTYPIKTFTIPSNASDITNNATLVQGRIYRNVTLSGNKKLIFPDTGSYYFNSFNLTNANTFEFNFNNRPGTIKIYVLGTMLLDKVSTSIINGGGTGKILTQTNGNAATAFKIANGNSNSKSRWSGTVWAPYGGIDIGSGTGNSEITGALWSGTTINIQSGVNMIYSPYSDCTPPNANAGPDKPLSFEGATILTGTSSTSSVSFSWQALNGGTIEPPVNTASVNVSTAGTYVLTVANAGTTCAATDTVIVTSKVVNRIGSELLSLYQNYPPTDTDKDLFIIQSDSVVIDIIVYQGKYDSTLALVRDTAYGLTRERPTGTNYIITGLYPIKKLLLLNFKPTLINYVRPHYDALSGNTSGGIAYTLGDIAIRTDFIRNGYGLFGDSVKVGILSDSYNTIPGNPAGADESAGDLPSGSNAVQVLQEFPYGQSVDEGRAMLQIVHDIAPNAKLAFRTGFITPGDMADGIRQLKLAGCDVIVDDITHITEPFLNDGVIAKAVNEVSGGANPVVYFSAAGNFSNKSYQSNFVPAAAPAGLAGNAHRFGGTSTSPDIYQRIKLKKGPQTIVLQWQDSIYSLGQIQTGGTQNDLDIYLTGNNGVTLFGYNRNNIGGDPIETFPFYANKDTIMDLVIVRSAGTSTNLSLKYIIFRGEDTLLEYNNQGNSTVVGQANADSSFTIGAVRYTKTPQFGVNPPEIESFSSIGGTITNGVKRNKPDFTAPDGVNTTVEFGSSNIDGDNLPNFFGTSAAAPHAAAATALLLQARRVYYNNEKLKPWQVKDLFKNTALDMAAPGFDSVSGNGLIRADVAIQTFATPNPDLIRLTPVRNIVPGTDTLTVIVTGNFLSKDSTKVYVRDSAVTTVILTDSTGYALIPAFGAGNPPVYAVTTSLSPSGLDGGSSDSLYFFTPERKQIKIKAVDTSIKYGDSIPYTLFRSLITVNDTLIQNLAHPLTANDLGLGGNAITYTSNATDTSPANRYAITPAITRAFNINNPVDAGLLELYKYDQPANHNPNGVLTITPMPITITPVDETVVYGKTIPGIEFIYDYDESAIAPANRTAFLNKIKAEHESEIAQKTFVFIDDSAVLNGRMLDSIDLVNLSFLVSGRSVVVSGRSVVANGRSVVVNGRSVVVSGRSVVANSTPAYDTTDVVDLSLATLFNYQLNNDTVPLVNGRSVVASKALASGRSVVVNGRSVVALSTLVNGRSVVALSALVNSENGGNEEEDNVAAVLDSADVWATAEDSIVFKSVNAITGLTVGRHFIVPASYVSSNFKVTYGLGHLEIKKDTLIVKARDTSITYGMPQPAYKSNITGYDYNDAAGSVIKSGPTYSLQGVSGSIVPAGTYTIVPDNLKQYSPENYFIRYQTGVLTVGKAPLTVKADDKGIDQGSSVPPQSFYSSAYTGLLNNDASRVIGPAYTLSPSYTSSSPAGMYSIIPSALAFSPSSVINNYAVTYLPGTLYVNPKGNKAKNVKPSLDCIDTLINDPQGYKYLARFAYDNPNATPVFVPIGTNNYITASGPYSGVQPVVFVPGNAKFTIKFTGDKMTWVLITYNGNQKSSSSSNASSTSNKCNNGSARPMVANTGVLTETARRNSITVYPNPVTNKLIVSVPQQVTVKNEIFVSDIMGRKYMLKSVHTNTNGTMIFDVSELTKGIYYVSISSGNEQKIFKILKQ